ncbi:MAG: hypothetical protein ABIP94_07875 [Planctomycetota bacterium]
MTTPTTRPVDGWRWTRWLPLLTAVALALVAVFLRTCEVEAEGDLYHERAERLLEGVVLYDRFHPFGYVFLVAGLHVFVSSSLVAGALVSAMAAGLLVWSTGAVADRLRPGAGGPARLFTASNAVVWVLGTMACTDMTAAALTMASLALLCNAGGRVHFGRALAIGSAIGFAVGCRFGSLGIALLIGLGTLLQGRRMGTALGLGTGVVIGLAPQAWLATLIGKGPLENDNWHNMVLKIVCDDDLGCLQRLISSGTMPTLGSFLRDHTGDLLWRAAQDSLTAVTQVLPNLLMGSMQWIDGLQVWPLALALGGLWFATSRWRLAGGLTVLAAAATLSVCMTIAPRSRQVFSAAPFLMVGLAAGLTALHQRGGLFRLLMPALWLATVAIGGLQFRHYLAEQPERAVEVMRQLPQLVPRPIGLLTTNAATHRYTTNKTWAYLGRQFPSNEAAWHNLRQVMTGSGTDVFLVDRMSNKLAYTYFSSDEVPADFRRLLLDDDVVLLELRLPPTTWIDALKLSPDPAVAGQPLVLDLALSTTADLTAVMAVGAMVSDPAGNRQLLDFERLDPLRFRRQVAMPATPGTWAIEPFVLQINGTVQRWRSVEFVVTGP